MGTFITAIRKTVTKRNKTATKIMLPALPLVKSIDYIGLALHGLER